MRPKIKINHRLLTPILLIGLLLFAVLVTIVAISAYNREQNHIRAYTRDNMKLLTMDLDNKLMAVESGLMAVSHMDVKGPADSLEIYSQLDNFIKDQKYIRAAGYDSWDMIDDEYISDVLLVVQDSSGAISHEWKKVPDTYVDEPLMDAFHRARQSLDPAWSLPFRDTFFTNVVVLTCYQSMMKVPNAVVSTDISFSDLLGTIDSLNFYEGSTMIVNAGGKLFTLDDGTVTEVSDVDMDEKRFTKISTHYDRFNIDIINLVPNELIHDSLWVNFSIILALFIAGLLLIAVLVHRSFRKAQANLAESVRKSTEEEAELKRIERDISIAARIQNQMLTNPGKTVYFKSDPDHSAAVHATIIPAREVGGDLYEYRLSGHKLVFCTADISGKGIPASIVMSTCCSLFNAYISENPDPDTAHMLSYLNTQMCRKNDEMMFATMWAGVLDLQTGAVCYSSAGHNPPVLLKGSSASFLPAVQAAPLGLFEDSTYNSQETQLGPGDTLLLYTDGITEATSPDNTLFGEDRLLEACLAAQKLSHENAQGEQGLTPESLCRHILECVRAHASTCRQSDDITLLAITCGK